MPRALVFAGGGSLGAVQVGMLKALTERGLTVDFVVGASVGAINAAYFATDPTSAGVARLEALWRRIRRPDVFPRPTLAGLAALLRGGAYVVEPAGLVRLLERELPERKFSGLKLPCTVVATDLLDGLAVHIRTGDLIPALAASAAIPGLYPPVRLAERTLIDGGIANHSPIAAAVELGATHVVLLPTGYSCTRRAVPTSAVAIALQGFNILTIGKLMSSIKFFRSSVTIDIVPPLCPLDVSPVDFRHTAELIERAERSTREWLAHGVELVDGLPHQLSLHTHANVETPFQPHVI
jgi:NTE family protein